MFDGFVELLLVVFLVLHLLATFDLSFFTFLEYFMGDMHGTSKEVVGLVGSILTVPTIVLLVEG